MSSAYKTQQQTVSQHVYRNHNFSGEQLDHQCTVRITLEIKHPPVVHHTKQKTIHEVHYSTLLYIADYHTSTVIDELECLELLCITAFYKFHCTRLEPADLELDVWLLYGYHYSSSEIESQGYKPRSSLGFGFRNGKVAFVVTRSV